MPRLDSFKVRTAWRILSVLSVWTMLFLSFYFSSRLNKDPGKDFSTRQLKIGSRTKTPGKVRSRSDLKNSTEQSLVPDFYQERNESTLYFDSNLDAVFSHIPPPGEIAEKRIPQAIIIGVGKCGTRALLEYLRMHPYIKCTGPEVHYFDIDDNLTKGLEWYRMQMPKSYSNQVTMEKSPSYFFCERAVEEIYKMNKSIKLILIVKDPVLRILTQSARMPNPEDHEMLYLKTVDGVLTVNENAHTVMYGIYVNYLKMWMKKFPLSQIHVIQGEELVTQPAAEILKVQHFLGVIPMITERNFYYNASKGFYCPRPFGEPIHCLSSGKGLSHPTMTPQARKLLYDFYRPHNERLFQLLNRRFDWEPKQYISQS